MLWTSFAAGILFGILLSAFVGWRISLGVEDDVYTVVARDSETVTLQPNQPGVRCNHCGGRFDSHKVLVEHIVAHHPEYFSKYIDTRRDDGEDQS